MTSPATQPSPMLLFDTVTAYQRSQALKAAVELDLFTAIGEGAATAPEIAARAGASERGVRILCDYLTVGGFLTKEEGRYGLTQDSAVFLDRRSPAYAGGIVGFLMSPQLMSAFEDLTTVVRTGTTASADEGTMEVDHPIWVDFANGMAAMMRPAAEFMAETAALDPERPVRILDLAAGHGIFGATFLERYPKAEVVAVDWKNVLDVAARNAERMGVSDRWTPLAGSAFEVDYGGPYDVVLVTNFLHHFDAATNTELMRKVRAALGEGGRAITLEFVPNDDRVTPESQAGFSLVMLASTRAGDAYTFAEYDRMFRDAGFSRNEMLLVPPGAQTVIISQA